MNPFVHIAVRPAYTQHISVVSWNLLQGYEDAQIYVYRSLTNTTANWELLNTLPLIGINYLSDASAREDFVLNYQYRLLAIHDGKEYDSVVVTATDALLPREYRNARKILNNEWKWMTRGRQGIEVYLFSPLRAGIPSPTYDAVTGQQFSTGAPTNPALDSYGERFVGGYNRPLKTWVKFTSLAPLQVDDMEGGEGVNIQRTIQTRCLAYPVINRDDLLINPITDDRYVVNDGVQPYLYAGRVPIAYDVSLTQLLRTDPRYRLPLP